jgi:hypothetical protein
MGIQVISQANTLGLQISTAQLFQYQTVAELAKVMRTSNVNQAAQILKKVQQLSKEEIRQMLEAKKQR